MPEFPYESDFINEILPQLEIMSVEQEPSLTPPGDQIAQIRTHASGLKESLVDLPNCLLLKERKAVFL